MASDSDSSYAGTHDRDRSPFEICTEPQPPLLSTTMSMVEIVSSSTGRRSSLKPDPPGLIKRAVSSPNVRDLVRGDSIGMSQSEKKRNKLGYHRTAVACVHCRRRKIRCILAMDDPATRCHNCIRLKKDCHFYPVDQQPPLGKRTRSSSKNEDAMNESLTPETSPALAGAPWENAEAYATNPFQTSTMSSENAGSYPFSSSMLPSESSGLSSASYCAPNVFPHSAWSSAPLLHASQHTFDVGGGHMENMHPSHWQSHMHSASAGYEFPHYASAPIAASLPASSQDNFSGFSPTHAIPHSWPLSHPLLRSMSVASPGELQHFQSTYFHDQPLPLHRQSTASDLQTPALSSNTNPTPPSSDTQSTPGAFSFGDHGPSGQIRSIFPTWTSIAPAQSPQMPTSGPEGFGQVWYNIPPGLADVKEEEELAHLHTIPQPHAIPQFRSKPG